MLEDISSRKVNYVRAVFAEPLISHLNANTGMTRFQHAGESTTPTKLGTRCGGRLTLRFSQDDDHAICHVGAVTRSKITRLQVALFSRSALRTRQTRPWLH